MSRIKALLTLLVLTNPAQVWAQQCAVSSVAVSFGEYDRKAQNPLNATGSISVVCAEPVLSVVKLDAGKHSDGLLSPRKMFGEGDYLKYDLCADAACTKIWGDGTNGSFTQAGKPNLAVYGRVLQQQNVRPGVYGDFVTIIVEW